MSTNYYIHTKDMDLGFDLLPNVVMEERDRYFSIHILQTYTWFKPDFERHGKIRSWKELKDFLIKNEGRYELYDEHGSIILDLSNFIHFIELAQKMGTKRSEDLGNREWWYDKDGYRFLNFEFT